MRRRWAAVRRDIVCSLPPGPGARAPGRAAARPPAIRFDRRPHCLAAASTPPDDREPSDEGGCRRGRDGPVRRCGGARRCSASARRRLAVPLGWSGSSRASSWVLLLSTLAIEGSDAAAPRRPPAACCCATRTWCCSRGAAGLPRSPAGRCSATPWPRRPGWPSTRSSRCAERAAARALAAGDRRRALGIDRRRHAGPRLARRPRDPARRPARRARGRPRRRRARAGPGHRAPRLRWRCHAAARRPGRDAPREHARRRSCSALGALPRRSRSCC